MKIIFAFRTRLFRLSAFPARSASASRSVPASFRKILSLFAMQLSIFFLFVLRIVTYGNSRFLSTLLRLGQVRFPFVRSRPSLTSTRLFQVYVWWAQMDSDHRPHAYQACALTS